MLAHVQDCTPMPYPNKQVLVLVYSVQEKQPQAKRGKIKIFCYKNVRKIGMKANRKSFTVPLIHS